MQNGTVEEKTLRTKAGDIHVRGRCHPGQRIGKRCYDRTIFMSYIVVPDEYKIGTTSPFWLCFCVLLFGQPCRKVNEIPFFVISHNPKVAGSNPAPATNAIIELRVITKS